MSISTKRFESLVDQIGKIGQSWPLLVILACLQCTILWLAQYLPLQDYPGHLLRHHILASLLKGEQAFQEYFAADWRPVPYLASDLLAVPLELVTNPIIVGKLILSTYVIGFPLCFTYFAKKVVRNGHTLWPYGFLFTYNHFFQRGYVNYCLGTAIFLILAGYAGSKSIRHIGPKHIAILSLLGLATYFSHLFAWTAAAIYLAVAAWRGRRRHRGIVVKYFVALAPSLILLSLMVMSYAPSGEPVGVRSFHLTNKLREFAGNFLGFRWYLEALAVAAPLAALGGAVGRSVLSRSRRTFLISSAILFGAFLLIPDIGFVSVGRRLAWFSVLLACPTLAEWPHLRRAGSIFALVGAIALITSTGFAYAKLSKQIASDVNLMRQMPVGQTALPIEPEQLKVGSIKPYRHASAYYGLYRDGIVPWTWLAQWHPVRYRRDLPVPIGKELMDHALIDKLARTYSWILVWGKEQIGFRPPPGFTLWRDNSHLYIYKNERPGVESRE